MPKKKEDSVKVEKGEIIEEVEASKENEEKPTKEDIPKITKKSKEVEADPKKSDTDDFKKAVVHKSHKPNVRKYIHGKKYRATEGLIEKGREYEIREAISLVKKTSTTKFDSSVEIHINLNLDLTNPENQIRGSVLMPAGLGKSKKICAIVSVDKQKEAKDAGADTVGGQDIVEKIEKGWLDFDVVVATPDMMPHIGKIGKILGTKGLMPNPKTGTVTTDIAKAVSDIKKGKADYRVDGSGTIHASIGKVSFDDAKLKENIEAFIAAIHQAKPASAKGTFIESIFLTSTMGPSVKIIK